MPINLHHISFLFLIAQILSAFYIHAFWTLWHQTTLRCLSKGNVFFISPWVLEFLISVWITCNLSLPFFNFQIIKLDGEFFNLVSIFMHKTRGYIISFMKYSSNLWIHKFLALVNLSLWLVFFFIVIRTGMGKYLRLFWPIIPSILEIIILACLIKMDQLKGTFCYSLTWTLHFRSHLIF